MTVIYEMCIRDRFTFVSGGAGVKPVFDAGAVEEEVGERAHLHVGKI